MRSPYALSTLVALMLVLLLAPLAIAKKPRSWWVRRFDKNRNGVLDEGERKLAVGSWHRWQAHRLGAKYRKAEQEVTIDKDGNVVTRSSTKSRSSKSRAR